MIIMGDRLLDDEVDEMIQEVDMDGDGDIDYDGMSLMCVVCFICKWFIYWVIGNIIYNMKRCYVSVKCQ